ncbi:MAG: S-methyl-5-thioribose-1-phosphate isomerase [Deltaproteobacteria bacterium]|nr:S-methyl-5-thioribose-1-phosphate isomerase [Deltaproteobacteria bacterium]MBN2674382.1 S-methyl-5-thioribose-1-phosphate isomerase [Deltaproteobacteria bacterium]
MQSSFQTVYWKNRQVVMLDQRLLPYEEKYNRYSTVQEVADAIQTMVVRGAPAIGVAAAFGVALAAIEADGNEERLLALCDVLAATRPTAVNLFWAIERMKKRISTHGTAPQEVLEEAERIKEEDIAACKKMGEFGEKFIKDGATVLTHCNAGALATAGWGTALGVFRSAVAAGKTIHVLADETRPRLQGAKLTAWELRKDGIDVTVISDNAAASLLRAGKIDAVVVGSDRIAANGDVCNKIGTYSVALAADAAGVPFYVAAPVSTIDMSCPSGDQIPIEEREADEVTHINGVQILPDGVPVKNPAFDVTPHTLVTAIFTEVGVFQKNYSESLKKILQP